MKIINLSQIQYRNYANIHNYRNFGQSVEYSLLPENNNYKKIYLGLIDESNNLLSATLIIIKNISSNISEAIAPNGYLIDYSDIELVKIFTEQLIAYLKKEKVTYLITNPMFKYRVYDKKNNTIENNYKMLNNLYSLGYKDIGYNNDFSKYDIIINNNNYKEIYKNFNRNTKRNIKDSINMGITLHKGSIKDIDLFYEIIKKKTKHSVSYYYNLMNIYNTKDNKMEIFFTKINTEKFLITAKELYEKEAHRNEVIHESIKRRTRKMTEKVLNKKINSDSLLEKYKNLLNMAISLFNSNQKEIVVGTSAIIKNNREIYFLIDGYKEEYRSIHSSHILKWALIKKYSSLGYKIFNLGEIHMDYSNKNNKYNGQYIYKIGFGGNIIEYPPNMLLVINKSTYNAYIKLNNLKSKFKIKSRPNNLN